ncbi:MAG TPA: hypothetical protein VJM33_17050, partial [Microthrixaceae bacterium]|nr:hypothetical protein [Microthrixaceae bacterium]
DRYERIEIAGRPTPDQLVSTSLAPKRDKRGGRDRDRDRGPRGDRDRDADRGDRGRPRSHEGARRPARPRPPDLVLPERPKPKRLRAGRTHRNAALEALPPEQRPIAEQVLQGGVPAVRLAVDKQNEQQREQGLPLVKGDELLAMAETLVPVMRGAEWLDKAESALAIIDEIDLRDLRSVVVAGDAARGEEGRELVQQLRDGLSRRVDEEHAAWLDELRLTLAADRSVRALRLSSRPPKAGAPLPTDLAQRLAAAAAASLTAETTVDRWTTVLDALSTSPVRTAVTPASIPDPVPEALTQAVTEFAAKLPNIAELFGIDPKEVKPTKRRRPASRTDGKPRSGRKAPGTKPSDADKAPEAKGPETDASPSNLPEAEAEPEAEPTPDAPVAEVQPDAAAPVPAPEPETAVPAPEPDAPEPGPATSEAAASAAEAE